MKKLGSTFFSIVCMLFITTFAHASISMPAASPIGGASVDKSKYLTEIVVVNYSSHFVDIEVPVLRFATRLYEGNEQHIVSNDTNQKRVILTDYHGYIFFDSYVSRYDTVEVYDFRGKLSARLR